MTPAQRFRASAERAGPTTRPLVRWIIEHAILNPTVAELARALHVHKNTLQSRHARAGLLSPAQLISLARVTLASLLARHDTTAAEIAESLQCSSPASFCRWLRTQYGTRWSEFRDDDLEGWLAFWEQAVAELP